MNGTVTAAVTTTTWMADGMPVWVQGGGFYTVESVTDATNAVLLNYFFEGNAAPGAPIPSGAALTAGGPFSRDTPPDANDVYAWDLGESAAPYANQGSAGSVNMTLLSGSIVTSPGLFGVAPNSDDTSSSVTGSLTGGAGSAGVAYPVTISCWFYQPSNPGPAPLVGRSHDTTHDSGNESIALSQDSGTLELTLYIGSGIINFIANYPGLAQNAWHHVGATYDGSTVLLYVDGDNVFSRAQTARSSTTLRTHGTSSPRRPPAIPCPSARSLTGASSACASRISCALFGSRTCTRTGSDIFEAARRRPPCRRAVCVHRVPPSSIARAVPFDATTERRRTSASGPRPIASTPSRLRLHHVRAVGSRKHRVWTAPTVSAQTVGFATSSRPATRARMFFSSRSLSAP